MARSESPLETMERLKMSSQKKILIIGASGYIGGHLNEHLVKCGHKVYTTSNKNAIYGNLTIQFDFINSSYDMLENLIKLDALDIDAAYVMAWPYLHDYKDERHLIEVLPKMIDLYKFLVNTCKIKNIIFAGTCFEYGRNGSMSEDDRTNPQTNYAMAKDLLRKILMNMSIRDNVKLKWIRIFYAVGGNQRETSLIASLDKAIKNNEPVFKMSKGDQMRDFIYISNIVKVFEQLGVKEDVPGGVYNCGSGNSLEVRTIVEGYIKAKGSNIKIDNQAYSYREDEPFAFWADMTKTNQYVV